MVVAGIFYAPPQQPTFFFMNRPTLEQKPKSNIKKNFFFFSGKTNMFGYVVVLLIDSTTSKFCKIKTKGLIISSTRQDFDISIQCSITGTYGL